MASTAALTAAGCVGSLAAGGSTVLALVLAAGVVLLALEAVLWSLARTFGRK